MTENALNITTTGLPINDTSTGTFSAVALTAKGDLLVHNGSNYTRIAVGTNGEIFKADSGESTGQLWEGLTFSGDLIPIANSSASTSASISFTDLDFSTYGSLFINMRNVHPATDNVSLNVLVSVDNGSSYLATGYKYVYKSINATSASDSIENSSSATSFQAATQIGSGMGEGVAGWFMMLPSDDPTNGMKQTIEWQLYGQDTNTELNGYWGGGLQQTTSTIDAIKFEFSTGNIETGDFYLYGYNAS